MPESKGIGLTAITWLTLIGTVWLLPGNARAWRRFDQGCKNCHNFFQTPAGWPACRHTVHSGDAYMGNACDLCHIDGTRQCSLATSRGTGNNTGVGCLGCHGRQDGNGDLQGFGLMKKHGGTCSGCHTVGTPAPESSKPPYYGTADTRVAEPCNTAPQRAEDYSGDGIGLDNDGDGLVDEDDDDCQAAPPADGGTDAGAGTDGGPDVDGGTEVDAGTDAGAGTDVDTGSGVDGGTTGGQGGGGCTTSGSSLAWPGLLGLLAMLSSTVARRRQD